MATKKGQEFERETADLAGSYGKRVPRSGAYGTTEGITRLAGDCRWDFPWLSKLMVGECKHGYSRPDARAKSMTLKREWFDKHKEQSKQMEFLPFWAMKLKFTNEKYLIIPFEVMSTLLEEVNDLYIDYKRVDGLISNATQVAMENKELKDQIFALQAENDRLKKGKNK